MCNVDGQAGALQGLSKLKLSLAFIENVLGLNNSLKALNRAHATKKVVEYLFSVQAYCKPWAPWCWSAWDKENGTILPQNL